MVVLVAAGIALHVVVTSFRYVSAARGRAFNNAAYYHKARASGLLEEHRKATGSDKLPTSGYPDAGSGRFAALLSYAAWLDLNNALRAQNNYVEGAPSIITAVLLAGAFYPRIAAVTGVAYMVGRELYSAGYVRGGPGGRNVGATVLDVALAVELCLALYGGWSVCGAGAAVAAALGR